MPVTTSVSTQEKPDTTVPSVSPTIYGDVNVDGFINVSDVVALNMYILSSGENKLSDVGIANADCVKDGGNKYFRQSFDYELCCDDCRGIAAWKIVFND